MSRLRSLSFTALIALGVLAFAELASLVAWRALTGAWFSRDAARLERARVAGASTGAALPTHAPVERIGEPRPVHLNRELLHPYLGYTRAGRPEPRACADGELLVGVFGGSLAERFAASGALEPALRDESTFAGLSVSVVNLALDGYKQPQQLVTLVYWLVRGGELDVVVNLDGFNEMALHRTENALHGVAAEYPRQWYSRVDHLPDPELHRLVGLIVFLEAQRSGLARRMADSPLRVLVSAILLWKVRDLRLEAELVRAQERFQSRLAETASPAASGSGREYASEAAMYEHLEQIWERSALLMQRQSEASGIRYLHFVQPNQYVPGSKKMGERERQVAFRRGFRRLPDVRAGYPLLSRGIESLRDQGVEVRDLTMVFADVEEPVYSDYCCHLNARGNEIVAKAIARVLADDPALRAIAEARR